MQVCNYDKNDVQGVQDLARGGQRCSHEHEVKNTSKVSLDGESETDRALWREVRRLTEALSKLRTNAKRGRRRNVAVVFFSGVMGVRDVRLTPGDVIGVGSRGTLGELLCVRE